MVIFHSYVSLPEGSNGGSVNLPPAPQLTWIARSFHRSLAPMARPFFGTLNHMGMGQNPGTPCSSHQNSWVKMDVHPTKNCIFIGIDPYPYTYIYIYIKDQIHDRKCI